MARLYTEVMAGRSKVELDLSDKVLTLGSCFSDEMGRKMADAGFALVCNPFGTLYNPESIASAVARLDSDEMFGEADCVQMGAGLQRICSFEHHSAFSAPTAEAFLEQANARLAEARAFWRECNTAILTFGTAFVWRRDGRVVSNCLKRPASEFGRDMLGVEDISALLGTIVAGHPDKRFIFTVSPIRHMGDGAHANTLSKARLHLGVQEVLDRFPDRTAYFPAFEILNDELRDYRFYANDLVHPRGISVNIIWERFVEFCVPQNKRRCLEENLKASAAARHIPHFGR